MNVESKYAELLVNYCLAVKEGHRVYVQSTLLAAPLVKEVYREIIKAGGSATVNLEFSERNKIFMEHASEAQLKNTPLISQYIFENFDAYLYIKAPFNLREDSGIDPEKRKLRSAAMRPINQLFSKRTAEGTLTRSLCLYPTQASAQEAGMSLSEYKDFVYNACHLYSDNPEGEWLAIREKQQHIVDYLNKCERIQYKSPKTDISFSVKGRTWINSDGRVNMPSGEVFSGPVEDSVSGVVHFDYPSIYLGREVRGVTFEVVNGEIQKWTAEVGQEVLDEVMALEGARFFGEVAIGTNYNIQRPTKNILFDEKIGGTIHMAVGQSYIQTGGKNKSAIHWDLISDMKNGGQIIADDKLIYKDGQFII